MSKFESSCLTFCFILLFNFLNAANSPKLSKVPIWVTALELPVNNEVKERKITEGYYYLLTCNQVNIQTEESFVHYAIKVVNNAGVQNASDINISYDPAYETISFHFIRITRNGEIINKFKEKEIKIIQREDNLESKIYDGSLTAYLSLSDVRVGDIIEYSYTIKGRNPIFNHKYFTTFDMAYSSPVAIIYYKIVSPINRKLNFKTLGKSDVKPLITTQNNLTIYEWKTNCNEPIDFEENVPTTYNPYPFVDISEYNTWEEVVNWAIPMYNSNKPLSKKLKDKIFELTKNKLLTEEKIVTIFRFLQNEIRYMGFEIGLNSHKPHEPNTVFDNRYGDCKDKVFLFCSMLKEIGINAYPNLVNTYSRANINNELPSPGHFNHVTACVELKNTIYWLDLTNSHQGGNLENIQYVNYGYTLILKSGVKDLTKINLTNSLRKITTKEIFTYKNLETPVDLIVTTRYEGAEADDARYKFETTSKADIEKSYIEYYTKLYKTTNLLGEINFKDDTDNNVFITFEEYELPEMWLEEDGQKQLQIYHNALLGSLTIPKSTKRNFPLAINFPFHYIQNIIIKMPEYWNFSPENINISNDYFNYNFNAFDGEEENSFELNYEFKNKSDEVSVQGMNTYSKNLDEVKKYNIYQIFLTNIAVTPENVDIKSNSTAIMIVIALIVLLLSIVLTIKLYKFDVKPSFPNENLHLGGWLLLPFIGLCISPFIQIYGFFDNNYFEFSIIEFLTETSRFYSPLTVLFIIFEMGSLILIICFQALVVILFVKKRSSTPQLVIINFVGIVVYYFIEILFMKLLYPSDVKTLNELYTSLIKSIITGLIWIPYFLKSNRVKETFVVTYHSENEFIVENNSTNESVDGKELT